MPVRFIIFTPSRTGSTTLQRLLNTHAAMRCLWEPFNPTHPAPFAVKSHEILKQSGLDAALDFLAKEGTGFKHVWHPGGWPFEDPTLNDRLLLHGCEKIIVLRRINALQRAMSERISQQMKLWTIYSDADLRKIRNHIYRPLDIDQLRSDMDIVEREQARLFDLAKNSGKPVREVTYEQLFLPSVPFDNAIEVIQSLLEFLNHPRLTDRPRLQAMRSLLDPAMSGFQNANHYRQIPNIHEIEQALGSDQTGHVFQEFTL